MGDLCHAYREAYRKLIVALPVEKFTPFLSDKQLFVKVENGGKTPEEQRPQEALLNKIKEDLEAGTVTSFEQLLEVMTSYAAAENDIVIDRILRTMNKEIEGNHFNTYTYRCITTHYPTMYIYNMCMDSKDKK